MGSKTQVETKESRPVNKCEVCKKEFVSSQSLKAHTFARHPEKAQEMQANKSEKKDEKRTAFVPPTSRSSKRLQQKKPTDKDIEDTEKSDDNLEQGNKKTVFECPKCAQQFSVYFLAYRHIQKRHCEDKDGNPVDPNSSTLIRPISKEVSDMSSVKSATQDNGSYSCLACKQIFKNVTAFDQHVEASHKENVNVFLLSSMIEFETWKTNIEAKQKLKYLSLSNTAQKQYYQCNYVSTQNSANITHLCPSMIVIREISKGVKITYYKEHHEHVCESVPTPNDTITTEENSSDKFERYLKKGEDVIGKIKLMLDNVIEKASMLKKKQLKPLYLLAVKMHEYANDTESNKGPTNHSIGDALGYENDSDDNLDDLTEKTHQNITDDQITKALEAPRLSARLKRKSEGSPIPDTKKTVQKPGLKENNSLIKDVNSVRLRSPHPNISTPINQSPSFNDSYKQFIEGTSPKTESEIPKAKTLVTKTEKDSPPAKKVKKEIMKTKIGQFSPRKNVVKTDENVVRKKKLRGPNKSNTSLDNVKLEEVDFEVVEQENDCNILILKI